MINFEELRIKDNGLLVKEQWNGLLDSTKRYFNGNVGLGVDAPEAKLQIEGKGGQNIDLLVNGRIRSNNNDGGLWVASDRFIGGVSTNKVGFYNNKAWRLVVQNNGNVGMGTSTPMSTLSLGPSLNKIKLALYQNSSGTSYYGMGVTSGRFYFNIGNPKAKYVFLDRAGNGAKEIFTILGNGNIGIGRNPAARLDVQGNSSTQGTMLLMPDPSKGGQRASHVHWGGTGDWYIRSAATSGKVIIQDSGGMVGIGTSNPKAMLHVNGVINAKLRNIGDKKNVQYNSSTGEVGYDNSTRRDKRNITPLLDDFGKIMQLQPRRYTRPFDQESWEIGYIAEEVKSLGLNNLVFYDEDNNPDGINYRKLCLYLVEIVREHERKLNPKSPYLEKYIENEVPIPDLKSTKEIVKDYLDYHRISYSNTDTKEELLKKVECLNE